MRQLAHRINGTSNGFKGSRRKAGAPANTEMERTRPGCRTITLPRRRSCGHVAGQATSADGGVDEL